MLRLDYYVIFSECGGFIIKRFRYSLSAVLALHLLLLALYFFLQGMSKDEKKIYKNYKCEFSPDMLIIFVCRAD